MQKGLISIIVPCFKQSHFLDDCLKSVIEQTYQDWECFIINDGSPDNTEEIAKKWISKDNRFKYVYKENGGLSSARNAGMEISQGEYIQFLDSDDVLDKNKLEVSMEIVANLSNNVENIVITNFRMFIDNPLNSKKPFCQLNPELFNFRDILLKWENNFSIPIHCGLFHTNLFNNFQFPEELKAKEDWIMWMHIFQKKIHVSFVDKPLSYYRINPDGMTNDFKLMQTNHMKAIEFIENVIPANDYIDYLMLELKQKYSDNLKLKTTIYNYQNSNTYKVAKILKDTFLMKFFFKIIKK